MTPLRQTLLRLRSSALFARLTTSYSPLKPTLSRVFVRRYDRLTGSHYTSSNTDETSETPTVRYLVAVTTLAGGFGVGWYFGNSQARQPTLLDTVLSTSSYDARSTTALSLSSKPDHDVSVVNLRAAREEIVAIVGEDNINSRLDDIERHTGSAWSSHVTDPNEAPAAIVMPGSTQEVSGIMKICHRRRIPVVAFFGGTSLEGHFANTRRGMSIDFSRMNQILTTHGDDLDVVVQPGLGYEQLNERLAQEQLFFPPDPGPGAMIGGMVGTGCSGTNAYRYGTMKNWVVSLTMVLADGTIIKTRQRPVKSSAGYDLTRLFVGNEGTLGLVTEAVLRVTVLPSNVRVAVAAFPSIRSAAECVDKVVQQGIQVAAVELLDEVAIKCMNESEAVDREFQETPTLFFKFNGTETAVREQIDIVQQMANAVGSESFAFAKDEQEAEDMWGARKTVLWGATSIKKHDDDHIWITDVAVPVSNLPEMIELTKADLDSSNLIGVIVGHVGDGNFHTAIMYSDDERSVAEDVVHRMVNRAIKMEGTVTGEHGVGLVNRDYLPVELGQSTIDAMRRIKQALDPLCLLNCDKVIRVQEPE